MFAVGQNTKQRFIAINKPSMMSMLSTTEDAVLVRHTKVLGLLVLQRAAVMRRNGGFVDLEEVRTPEIAFFFPQLRTCVSVAHSAANGGYHNI